MKNVHSMRIKVKNSISSEICRKIAKIQEEHPDIWICPEDKHTLYVESEFTTSLIYVEVALEGFLKRK